MVSSSAFIPLHIHVDRFTCIVSVVVRSSASSLGLGLACPRGVILVRSTSLCTIDACFLIFSGPRGGTSAHTQQPSSDLHPLHAQHGRSARVCGCGCVKRSSVYSSNPKRNRSVLWPLGAVSAATNSSLSRAEQCTGHLHLAVHVWCMQKG